MSHDKKELPDEEIQRLLKVVVDHFDAEDRSVRERQIRLWKKLKYFFDGITQVWWSETNHDWRIWDEYQTQGDDQEIYDKPINVFKALLETIFAALSVSVPAISCTPDDAENSLDNETAAAGDKIAELIYKHNDVVLLWLHALFIYGTEGLVAAYHYTDEDEEYGMVEIPKYEEVESTYNEAICPFCKAPIDNELGMGEDYCLECDQAVIPEMKTESITNLQIVGVTQNPKTRQCIEVYGGLFVKTPVYARKQKDIPYLIYAYETHPADVIRQYEHLAEQFDNSIKGTKSGQNTGGMFDDYERWGRLSTQYRGDSPTNTITVRNAFLREWAFNVLPKDEADILKKEYPKGCKVVFANDQFAEACGCELDKHWTLTYNPLADYLQHDPLGNTLVPVQEITNNLISLILQTIEHGIPQTFADPTVLNFNQYRQTEATPGQIFPAKAPIGKTIRDGFYEVKTATLSQEVEPFMQRIQEAGQFTSGALPSLFGGAQPNSSKTAAQYAMSRAQALQRLQTPWKILTFWWKNIFGKVIPMYIESAIADEHFTKKDANGWVVNVFIKKAELQGKIGDIELEAAEDLPISWGQKKDSIIQFIQTVPEAVQYLAVPENLNILKRTLGMTDFVMPGLDDRNKQYEEIQLLIESEPITDIDQMTGQPMELPSVMIDPDIDNHGIEAEICRNWLVGMVGRENKKNNPAGYRNVLLHFKMHQEALQMQQMAQMANAQPSAENQQNQENQNG